MGLEKENSCEPGPGCSPPCQKIYYYPWFIRRDAGSKYAIFCVPSTLQICKVFIYYKITHRESSDIEAIIVIPKGLDWLMSRLDGSPQRIKFYLLQGYH